MKDSLGNDVSKGCYVMRVNTHHMLEPAIVKRVDEEYGKAIVVTLYGMIKQLARDKIVVIPGSLIPDKIKDQLPKISPFLEPGE